MPKQSIEHIDAELRRSYKRMPRLRMDRTWNRKLFRMMGRVTQLGVKHPDVSIEVEDLGNAQVRVYQPKETRQGGGGLLWIHGGGLVIGNARMEDGRSTQRAHQFGCVVVSIEYRVAPENPYPAAIDDCYAAWQWLLSNAAGLGVDTSRIVVAGESAGGGLAAALCQRILDTGGLQPAAQWLVYPMLDDRTATSTAFDATQHLGWDNTSNRFGWSAYLGHDVGRQEVPDWSVPGRRTDLAGLPPAWIGVGDRDLFFEEDRSYSERLQACGVDCELHVSEAAPHGFVSFEPDARVSRDFTRSADRFLFRYLAGEGGT